MSNTRAFPLTYTDSFSGEEVSNYGMTLRDYFAAKAMQAMIAQYPFTEVTYIDVPYLAYKLADEMVLHREKTK